MLTTGSFGYRWERTQNFGFVFGAGLMIRVRFCSDSEYIKNEIHVWFEFCKCRVLGSVRFGLGSSLMELETCFHGGHLLQINCNWKYQLID